MGAAMPLKNPPRLGVIARTGYVSVVRTALHQWRGAKGIQHRGESDSQVRNGDG